MAGFIPSWQDCRWTLPASTVVVDHAAAADPTVIAELAAHTQRSQTALILLDADENRWPPGPSAPLMKLLHEDLPWSNTLSASQPAPDRRPPQPDLDPVLHQAARLAETLRTDELRGALTCRAQLREQHQSSYRVHTAIGRGANRGTDRGRDLAPSATSTPAQHTYAITAGHCATRHV